jgi:hypothetical protein
MGIPGGRSRGGRVVRFLEVPVAGLRFLARSAENASVVALWADMPFVGMHVTAVLAGHGQSAH